MDVKIKSYLALAGTVLLFSFLVILARSFVVATPSMFLFFLRMSFASLAFLPFFIKGRVWQKTSFPYLIFVSLFSSVNVAFFMYGIEFTSASASQLIYSAMPILTIMVNKFILKHQFSWKTFMGVFIGFLGIMFIIYQSAVTSGETIAGSVSGNLLITVAMLSWLTYIFLSKKISRKFSPSEIGSTSVLVTFIVSIILYLLQSSITRQAIVLTNDLILATFFMGVFGTFMSYLLMQYAVRHLSPLTVNLTSYVQPIVVAILAGIFLGEVINLPFVIGAALVFTGLFITLKTK